MAYPVEIWPDSLPESIFGVCYDVLEWCRVLLCVSVVSQCSPIATRFGVYFLRGSYSCMRPFSQNLRLCGAVGVPVVSRCPDHNFWRTCDCRLFGFPVHFHLGVPVSPRPVSRCGGFVVVRTATPANPVWKFAGPRPSSPSFSLPVGSFVYQVCLMGWPSSMAALDTAHAARPRVEIAAGHGRALGARGAGLGVLWFDCLLRAGLR